MSLLGVDLGGTKLAYAVFSTEGVLLHKEVCPLQGRTGTAVGSLVADLIDKLLNADRFKEDPVTAVGISVPGISNKVTNTVWAPNIAGWEAYPLFDEIKKLTGPLPLAIESDRSCYILGELWKGAAQGCRDAVFLAVGTGIGAGIVVDGHLLQGAGGIAGAIGWLTLDSRFEEAYKSCGFFEYHASGNGLARMARNKLQEQVDYTGILKNKPAEHLTAHDLFAAYEVGDSLAKEVLGEAVVYWGMTTANVISLLNPQKIIWGGGVFGPAQRFIPVIREEAMKWAQPVSMQQVSIEASVLGSDAGVYGAGFLALRAAGFDDPY